MCNRYNFRCKNDNRPNCRFRETDFWWLPNSGKRLCFKAYSAIDVFVFKMGLRNIYLNNLHVIFGQNSNKHSKYKKV